MGNNTVPLRLNLRLNPDDREAVATIAAGIATPHRQRPTHTEAMRAALSIAAEAVRALDTADAR